MQRKLFLTLLILLAVCIGINCRMQGDIPQELLDFAEAYPETADFVRAYPKEHNKHHTIDLSDEIQIGCIPLLIQWDKRWGYLPYGDGWIGNSGCGPTALSMIVLGLTGNTEWNPAEIAALSESQGWYISGEGTSWDLLTEGAQMLGLHSETGELTADYIRQNLTPETPLITSMRPGDFTRSGHFIVLTGFDADGKLCINDPNSPRNSQKHWNLEDVLPQMKGIWKFYV